MPTMIKLSTAVADLTREHDEIATQLEATVRLSASRAKYEQLAQLYRREAHCWQTYVEVTSGKLTAGAALRAADRAFAHARANDRLAATYRDTTSDSPVLAQAA